MDPATLQIIVGFAICGFVFWLLYKLFTLIFKLEYALKEIVDDDYYAWWIRALAWIFWAPLALFSLILMILGAAAWIHNARQVAKWFKD